MNTPRESSRGTNRKTAILVGILFIVGTASGILSVVGTGPIMAGSTYPFNISASETEWITGTLLILLMGLSLAMVPVLLYPIFKKHNQVLAFGYVLFRGVFETVGVLFTVISMLLLLNVSEIYARTGTADPSNFQSLGSVLSAVGDWTGMISGLVFSIGALMIYTLFYQTRLIPRWLSAWGFIGGVLYFVANFVSLFGSQHMTPSLDSGIGLIMIPLFIQEMVFAVWLIVKGFDQQKNAVLSAKTGRSEVYGTEPKTFPVS